MSFIHTSNQYIHNDFSTIYDSQYIVGTSVYKENSNINKSLLLQLGLSNNLCLNGVITPSNILDDIRQGIAYSYNTPIIRGLLIIGATALFMGTYQPAIPVKTQDELGLNEFGYGIILGLNGIGALIGSIVLFMISNKVRKGYLLIFALVMFNSSVLVFAVAPNIFISALAMVSLGLAFSGWMISVPVMLQTTASEQMRGRVMSLYFMVVLTHQQMFVVAKVHAGIYFFITAIC